MVFAAAISLNAFGRNGAIIRAQVGLARYRDQQVAFGRHNRFYPNLWDASSLLAPGSRGPS